MKLFHVIPLILILTLQNLRGMAVLAEDRPVARTMSCNSRLINGKYTLTCSGYPSVPLNDPVFKETPPSTIHSLNLKHNHLQTIKSAEFSNAEFNNLNTIDLSNNQIRIIERGAFRDLDRLVQIDLSYNQIDSFDMEIFERNDVLQFLKLQGNPIHQFIGQMFAPLPALKHLDLSSCSLNTVPEQTFSQLINLQELFLNGNRIQRLDWTVFKNNNLLHRLQLENNPWVCDCHVKFLSEFLKVRSIDILNSQLNCAGPGELSGKPFKDVALTDLNCIPFVKHLKPIGDESYNNSAGYENSKVYSEIGKDLAFECIIEAYPAPEVSWYKDRKKLNFISGEGSIGRELGSENNPTHIRIEDVNINQPLDERYNYKYTKLLRIYKLVKEDIGKYSCYARNIAGYNYSSISLNMTNLEDEGFIGSITTGGSKIWLWIMITLVVLIIICCFLLCFALYRRRTQKKQRILKTQMMDKFKDSQNVLDEQNFFPTPNQVGQQGSNNLEDSAPLLNSNGMEKNQVIKKSTNSIIPDVAQGNAENVRSLSPDVFSPRPTPSTDLRRQFFTRQMSEPPISPAVGSTISLQNYNPRAMPQFNSYRKLQSSRLSNTGMQYNYPNYPQIRRPGSAMSLSNPSESIYASNHRPQFVRQFSAGSAYPPYATMRYSRERRPLSISSYTSEPPMSHSDNIYGTSAYVTLPRGYGSSNPQYPIRTDSGFGRSLSPTESNYSNSSYCTLPRTSRSRINPATGLMYDSVGPRTTADGGSNLSLNKIGSEPSGNGNRMSNSNPLEGINQGLMTPNKGKVKSTRNRTGSSTTPGSLRGRNDFFSFEPIPEVEGIEDSLSKLNSNSDIDKILLSQINSPMSTMESRYKKKKPPPIVTIPARSRKPVRTFEYDKTGDDTKINVNESKRNANESSSSLSQEPSLPTNPPPMKPSRSQNNSLENIYEEPTSIIERTEGTEV